MRPWVAQDIRLIFCRNYLKRVICTVLIRTKRLLIMLKCVSRTILIRVWWLSSRIISVISSPILKPWGCLKLMAFSMTWVSLAHSWMSVSVVSPINRMLSWICAWMRRRAWPLMMWSIPILTTIWCVFSSSMVRTSSLNKLHVRLNRLVRLNQLRPRRNWRKSLNQLSLLRNWRRRGIQPSKFFKLFVSKWMMSLVLRMSLFKRPWIYLL